MLIDRRRRRENQHQAAARLGIPFSAYQERELDKLDSRDLAPKIETLEANERCFLYRRRAGFTQARVARELGCCRWWLNQMERGVAPVDDLICYWEC